MARTGSSCGGSGRAPRMRSPTRSQAGARRGPGAPVEPESLDRMVRGSIAHLLLEELGLEHPQVPGEQAVEHAAQLADAEVSAAYIADLQELVCAAIEGDVLARALATHRVRR